MAISHFEPDLIRRYNVNGPRYTSYPTADQFREGDWIAAYDNALAKADIRALSLYLHIPFCSKICFYCACNKINTANLKRADSYVKRLKHEMTLHSQRIGRLHTVEQVHFGGGTPTFLSDVQLTTIFDALRDYFNLAEDDDRDFSIEIDPRDLAPQRIDHLAALGINRISIGVQDFDPAVQIAVNRIQSVAETRAIVTAARNNGIRSINIDLINGLPKQTLGGFTQTLSQVIELSPDRLSLYSYAHLPQRFKTQRQINADDIPCAETKLKLLGTAVEMLTEAGYEYVGMDHFAKSSDSLIRARRLGTLHRNFQGYTTHAHCELIGLGVSSIGQVGHTYVQNEKTLHDYYSAIDSDMLAIARGTQVSDRDAIIKSVIQDLMCRSLVNFTEFRTRTGLIFEDYFRDRWPELLKLQDDGLLRIEPDTLTVTKQGRYLVRIICMIFDAYLRDGSEKFSKAI